MEKSEPDPCDDSSALTGPLPGDELRAEFVQAARRSRPRLAPRRLSLGHAGLYTR